jgi:hypothetical protein
MEKAIERMTNPTQPDPVSGEISTCEEESFIDSCQSNPRQQKRKQRDCSSSRSIFQVFIFVLILFYA